MSRPRIGGRPSKDRVMITFYIDRALKAQIESLAVQRGTSKADTYRELLRSGLKTGLH